MDFKKLNNTNSGKLKGGFGSLNQEQMFKINGGFNLVPRGSNEICSNSDVCTSDNTKECYNHLDCTGVNSGICAEPQK